MPLDRNYSTIKKQTKVFSLTELDKQVYNERLLAVVEPINEIILASDGSSSGDFVESYGNLESKGFYPGQGLVFTSTNPGGAIIYGATYAVLETRAYNGLAPADGSAGISCQGAKVCIRDTMPYCNASNTYPDKFLIGTHEGTLAFNGNIISGITFDHLYLIGFYRIHNGQIRDLFGAYGMIERFIGFGTTGGLHWRCLVGDRCGAGEPGLPEGNIFGHDFTTSALCSDEHTLEVFVHHTGNTAEFRIDGTTVYTAFNSHGLLCPNGVVTNSNLTYKPQAYVGVEVRDATGVFDPSSGFFIDSPTGSTIKAQLKMNGMTFTHNVSSIFSSIEAGDVIRYSPYYGYTKSLGFAGDPNANIRANEPINLHPEQAEVFGIVESINADNSLNVVLNGSINLPAGKLFAAGPNTNPGFDDVFFLSGLTAGKLQNIGPTFASQYQLKNFFQTIIKPVYYVAPHGNFTGLVRNYLGYKFNG